MRIKLVTGDTPQIPISITDPATGLPIDLSSATVALKVRTVGGTLKATVACTLLTGRVRDDDTIDTTAPYNVAGAGGRCQANCDATVFDAAGEYEAEVEVTIGSVITTPYRVHKISVREDF